MYLYLDTRERDSFYVALIGQGKVLKDKKVISVRQHSEKLLWTIDGLFKSRGTNSPSFTKSLSRVFRGKGVRGWLRGIAVVKGPGSFTSLRVGVATANTLAYAWSLPVVSVKPGIDLLALLNLFNKKKYKSFKIVLPEYGQPPHITRGR